MKAEEFQQLHGKRRTAAKGSANPRDCFPFVFRDEPEQPNPEVAKPAAPRKMKQKFDGVAAIKYRLDKMECPYAEEFRFTDRRMFRADFCVGMTLIEYDGGTHSAKKGGHTSGLAIARDCEKANLAMSLGYSYLRFTVELLRHPYYFEDIVRATLVPSLLLPERSVKVIQARKKC